MTMILQKGPYQHQPGTVTLANVNKATKYSQLGQPEATIETWTITGKIFGNGYTEVNQKMADLIAAYSNPATDLIFYGVDGVTPSNHALYASQTLDKQLRIKKLPSFPTGMGGEYVNYRSYTIEVEAELPLSQDFIYHDFTEKLSFTGGGPVIGWLQCAVGAPQQQLCRQQSTYKVTQSGKAVGYLDYPPVPDPIWPAFLLPNQTTGEPESPRKTGQGYYEYPIAWTYHFESDVPLFGFPNRV